ncbi:GTPase activating protein homolog 3 [Eurosta solidaginis]|uniref:GTPase activating protein homolog 3 n=1 Tax=Eurosta solidaginis TaxID=178769 RepID=UPI003530FFFA
MDNIKIPFLPAEAIKTQRVEIYLNDLKERINELRLKHDEVIQNSVDIIKEIDDVSSGLLIPHNSNISPNANVNKIKKLIQEFETAKESNSTKTSITIDSKVDIRKILQNLEKLNESHVLKESLVIFKRAKESLDKIDTFLGTPFENVISKSLNDTTEPLLNATGTETMETASKKYTLSSPTISSVTINNLINNNNTKEVNNNVACTSPPKLEHPSSEVYNNSNSGLKNRINMFNSGKLQETIKCNKPMDLTTSCYASCCSSVTSMDVYQSPENVSLNNLHENEMCTVNSLEIGYEGDNDDSEYDLLALKRRKSKIPSATQ